MGQEYEKLEVIGEGRFGVVYKGRNRSTDEIVAMKKIRMEKLQPEEEKEGMPNFILRELSILQQLQHDHIVLLQDVAHQKNHLYLIFEYLDCDLKKYMESSLNLMESSEIKSFMYQILLGIDHCHKQKIIHRDLKPQNLLIDETARKVKIADFGLSRYFAGDRETLLPFSHEVVTMWYRAPEILLGTDVYSTTIDMWSIGCIFAEMGLGRPLFPGSSEIETLFNIFWLLGTPNETTWPGVTSLEDYQPVFPKFRSVSLKWYIPRLEPDAIDLLSRLLSLDPHRRISAQDALKHEYFNDLDVTDLSVQQEVSAQDALTHETQYFNDLEITDFSVQDEVSKEQLLYCKNPMGHGRTRQYHGHTRRTPDDPVHLLAKMKALTKP